MLCRSGPPDRKVRWRRPKQASNAFFLFLLEDNNLRYRESGLTMPISVLRAAVAAFVVGRLHSLCSPSKRPHLSSGVSVRMQVVFSVFYIEVEVFDDGCTTINEPSCIEIGHTNAFTGQLASPHLRAPE